MSAAPGSTAITATATATTTAARTRRLRTTARLAAVVEPAVRIEARAAVRAADEEADLVGARHGAHRGEFAGRVDDHHGERGRIDEERRVAAVAEESGAARAIRVRGRSGGVGDDRHLHEHRVEHHDTALEDVVDQHLAAGEWHGGRDGRERLARSRGDGRQRAHRRELGLLRRERERPEGDERGGGERGTTEHRRVLNGVCLRERRSCYRRISMVRPPPIIPGVNPPGRPNPDPAVPLRIESRYRRSR